MSNYEPSKFSAGVVARLRGFIARYDVNQADLAVLCDMSQSQFSKVIRGARPMTVDQMAVIADALSLELTPLIKEVETDISNRDFWTSPVSFVDEELDERVAPKVRQEDSLADGYARKALARWRTYVNAPTDNVPASRDDVALAASDDPNWQTAQEQGEEFP